MNTILFDLDGTLLQMETDRFMHYYMKALTEAFSPHMDPESFQALLWKGTRKMLENPGKIMTNEHAFYQTFFEEGTGDRQEMIQAFDHFYATSFEAARQATSRDGYMIRSVRLLKQKGYRLAVVTNPLFPLGAVERRIHWAGLLPEEFELITSFESMHACKPNLAFYEEVLEALKIKPQAALMVGNDAFEDLAAGKLGIRTYLITNCLLQEDKKMCQPDYEGSTRDFFHFVRNLPPV